MSTLWSMCFFHLMICIFFLYEIGTGLVNISFASIICISFGVNGLENYNHVGQNKLYIGRCKRCITFLVFYTNKILNWPLALKEKISVVQNLHTLRKVRLYFGGKTSCTVSTETYYCWLKRLKMLLLFFQCSLYL